MIWGSDVFEASSELDTDGSDMSSCDGREFFIHFFLPSLLSQRLILIVLLPQMSEI